MCIFIVVRARKHSQFRKILLHGFAEASYRSLENIRLR